MPSAVIRFNLVNSGNRYRDIAEVIRNDEFIGRIDCNLEFKPHHFCDRLPTKKKVVVYDKVRKFIAVEQIKRRMKS